MKLSIVIVSYNVQELLDKCLKSIYIASKNIDHEIYVVDNNSQDGTKELIINKHPRVRLIANTHNIGFSKANNQAIKFAKGEYVLILNPDTVLMPDTLVKMLKFMDQKDAKVAIATCKIELPSGLLDRDCRRSFPTPARALTHFTGLSKIFRGTKIFDSYYMGYISINQETEVDACVGAFMFIRRKILKEVGNFDEDYFFYGEDLDLCYRIRQHNYKIFYTPITKIIHHKGASSGIKKHSAELSKAPEESKKRAIVESTHAMELFYKKHYKGKYPLFITFAVIIAIEIVKNIRLFRHNFL